MDALQQKIQETIELLEARQKSLKKFVEAARSADDTTFDLRLDGIDPYIRFRRNLAAFAEYIPPVYQLLQEHQPEKFDAIVMADGELNVLDINGNALLYGDNPRRMLAEQYLNYRHSPNVAHYDIASGDRSYNFVHVEHMDNLRQAMADIYRNDNIGEHFPEAIKSLMMFGIGLGYQIEWLVRDCCIRNLYIFEPEIDLLFVSLFAIDWDFILRKIDDEGGAIHFSIALDPADHFSDFQRRISARGRYDASTTYCMVHYQSAEMLAVIHEVMAQYIRIMFGYGFFDDAMMSVSHQMENIRRGVSFFREKIEKRYDTPVFLVANGPSLDITIETVRALQGQALIVSLGSAINTLHKYGITPDLHMEMERTRPTVNLMNAINDPEYLRKIPLIALNTVHPDVLDFFDEKYLYCKSYEAGTNLLRSCDNVPYLAEVQFCNPTVSNMGMSVIAAMGFREVYLFGVDLGFPVDKHHSEKSIYYQEDGGDKKLFQIKQSDLTAVEGNFGGEVMTDYLFGQSARILALEIEVNEGLKVYNTGHGVKIRMTEPLAHDQIKLNANTLPPLAALRQALTNTVHIDADFERQIMGKIHNGDFDRVLDELVRMNLEPATSRYDLMLRVDKQFELVHTLEYSKDMWLADMIRGSLLYIHSLTQRGIMLPAAADDAINKYDQLCAVIVDYLEACRAKFHREIDTPDQTDLGHLWK